MARVQRRHFISSFMSNIYFLKVNNKKKARNIFSSHLNVGPQFRSICVWTLLLTMWPFILLSKWISLKRPGCWFKWLISKQKTYHVWTNNPALATHAVWWHAGVTVGVTAHGQQRKTVKTINDKQVDHGWADLRSLASDYCQMMLGCSISNHVKRWRKAIGACESCSILGRLHIVKGLHAIVSLY